MANVIEITDFTAPELDVYARLSEGQLLNRAEPEKGMFIAESPRVIERALDAGCVPVSFLSEDRHIEKEAKEILERCGEIPAYVASFDVLTQLTGYKLTRGMLCAMYRLWCPKSWSKTSDTRGSVPGSTQNCGAGERGQSYQRGGYLSLSCST